MGVRMVILIGGTSMTGKTLLSQKLLEKYKFPYLSIDHLKMGIFRGWTHCGFTPETNEKIITDKLWPVIKCIIMTNIENNQNIIIEGSYLPYNLDDIDNEYTSKIILCKICFSENYITNNYLEKIIGNKSIIEKREYDTFTIEELLKDNIETKKLCIKNNIKYFEIKKDYNKEIKYVYKWINDEYKNK